MSETGTDAQGQKLRTSKLAIISVVLSASAFVLSGISLTVWTTMGAVAFCLLLIALSVIYGIAALLIIGLSKKKRVDFKLVLLSIAASVVLYFMLGPMILISKQLAIKKMMCMSNLYRLGRAIYLYSEKNNGRYPEPDKWCDLLVENTYTDVYKSSFVCESTLRRGDSGPCHFAINPNCGPNSPPETVLLFETKGGWNQYGGPEMLTLENHRGEGCNILFNDTHADFVRPEEVSKLKWKAE